MIRRPHDETDRGMSIALTHILTIGITTILIAMLLMAGSTMLDTETERSTRTSLETVGERLAGEIDNVDRIANDSEEASVTLVADHPRRVANSRYSVALLEDCSGDEAPLIDSGSCIELSAHNTDVTVHVPLVTESELDTDASVSGGSIEIAYENDGSGDRHITLKEVDR
ncbi:DUF7266 family protein [Haloterrigena alkaliphila]|uniref:Uncharacterized protein n=1 Tax=Haloterrigena alkaliphila TaxID=2816475 RepID=A0A8A2VCZ0_9EURY|nr:hypothetical protein [Haloterrigena alkaliphila]QSW98095.1 hypothetical protein J0X25_11810 [Haloterrigena alkaliphila]